MMDDGSAFTTRRVGTTGHEIVTQQGTVIGWTVDASWAAILVALLNDTTTGSGEQADSFAIRGNGDTEEVARRAIEYLAYKEPAVTLAFDKTAPPSPQVRDLVAPYLHDATAEVAKALSHYLMKRLADDHLGFGGIDISSEVSPPPGT